MRESWAALLVMMACTPATPSTDAPPPGAPSPGPAPIAVATAPAPEPDVVKPPPEPEQDAQQELEVLLARVEIDDAPSHKRFQGVWLVTEDGQRHVIDYRARPWWLPFDGRRVQAKGVHYSPFGQAISAPHFRIELMTVIEPTVDDQLVSITGEQTLEGQLEVFEWPKQTKLADEQEVRFATGEHSWPLYERPDPLPELGKPLTVKGRIVELSPFAAHIGGGQLWIAEIE